MIFTETKIPGVYVIEIQPLKDERGFFACTWCQEEFHARGLNPRLVQCNISFNRQKGTLRGMHYQVWPHEEAKLVRCTRGAIYDVIIDLRPWSTAYKQWTAVELSGNNRKLLYIPEGCAHGFQTLEDNTEVFYQMSEFYQPQQARGVCWNDPAFGIQWLEVGYRIISDKDKSYPEYGRDLCPV
ncbi:MAG: dTDP-4-dehydrorhamnose 3,5-epimerase [Thermincolia bacterium]